VPLHEEAAAAPADFEPLPEQEPETVDGDVVREVDFTPIVDGEEAGPEPGNEAVPPARGRRGGGRKRSGGSTRAAKKPEGGQPRARKTPSRPRTPRARKPPME
jgi:hypothetical protein